MRKWKSFIAGVLTALIPAESLQGVSYTHPAPPAFNIRLSSSLGFISDLYTPKGGSTPDVILIQDLHVNRSVQFAISGILRRLKAQGLMPDHIAVEGATGPIDIASMQHYPDRVIRKEASDYLVRQGEMPGAMHFAVTEDGAVKQYAIESLGILGLRRAGIDSKSTFKVGETFTFTINPSRNGSATGLLVTLIFPDGRRFDVKNTDTGAAGGQ